LDKAIAAVWEALSSVDSAISVLEGALEWPSTSDNVRKVLDEYGWTGSEFQTRPDLQRLAEDLKLQKAVNYCSAWQVGFGCVKGSEFKRVSDFTTQDKCAMDCSSYVPSLGSICCWTMCGAEHHAHHSDGNDAHNNWDCENGHVFGSEG